MRRAAYIFGVVLIVLTVLLPLVGLWWWALFGMTKPVGAAVIFTPFITFGAGSALIILFPDGAYSGRQR